MSIASRPEKFYISPCSMSQNGFIPLWNELAYCCDVVFANGVFLSGRRENNSQPRKSMKG